MEKYIEELKQIAKELCYPKEVIDKLSKCTTEIQAENVMANWRKNGNVS
jgi:hypothetical protein